MRTKTGTNDLKFHLDVQESIMQVKDGHLMYTNGCSDITYSIFCYCSLPTMTKTGVYTTYNPFPLFLLTNPTGGSQAIHIALDAHEIASALFGKEVKFWGKDLGKPLQEVSAQTGQLHQYTKFIYCSSVVLVLCKSTDKIHSLPLTTMHGLLAASKVYLAVRIRRYFLHLPHNIS